jgi:hypothetical protein
MALLSQLFTEAYPAATSDEQHSAAFQLAVWEIIYDSASLDLAGGAFTASGGNAGTLALAQQWLRNLAGFTGGYNLFLLRSPHSQDFVTTGLTFGRLATAVPEPGSIALFAIGLLGLYGILRLPRARRSAGRPAQPPAPPAA